MSTWGPPPFPTESVNSNLESSVASKRQRGFALAEEALGKGATIPSWTLELIVAIALRSAALTQDRWRAIELLRIVGITDEVREALVREWALVPDSTIGPFEHESGPMFYVVREGAALNQAFALMAAVELADINRVVIRDLLDAMRVRLMQTPELVRDDEAAAWRSFCERVLRLDSSNAPPNERFLIDKIVRAIDG